MGTLGNRRHVEVHLMGSWWSNKQREGGRLWVVMKGLCRGGGGGFMRV